MSTIDDMMFLAKSSFFSCLLKDAAKRQPRNSNIIIFVSEGGIFRNTKYAFITLSRLFKRWGKDIKVIWFGDSKEKRVIENHGLLAISKDVEWQKTAITLLQARVAIYGTECFRDIDSWFWQGCLDGAVKIQLCHGVPAAKHAAANYLVRTQNFFAFTGMLHAVSEYDFVIAESDVFVPIYNSFFPSSKVLPFGAPRNDFLIINNLENDKIYCMGNDLPSIEKIKKAKEEGLNVVIVCPTFPEGDMSFDGWIDLVENLCEMPLFYFVVKPHPFHPIRSPNTYDKFINVCRKLNNFLIIRPDEDIYYYLKLSDALITDYSSVKYDYIILGRPILVYDISFDQFLRYRDIPELSFIKRDDISVVCSSPKEIMYELKNSISDKIRWRERLLPYAKLIHKNYEDGKAGERLAKFILSFF